jgi:predicted secreted protein
MTTYNPGDTIDAIDVMVYTNTSADPANPTWDALGGQQDATLETKSKIEDTTAKDSPGRASTGKPSYFSWSVSCTMFKKYADNAQAQLLTAQMNRQRVQLIWMLSGTTQVVGGYAWVDSVKDAAKDKGGETLDVSFTGDGPITLNPAW